MLDRKVSKGMSLMSTTKERKESALTDVKFHVLGARFSVIQFKEENFLSNFNSTKAGDSKPKSLNLQIQVSTGNSEFSKHPPNGEDVLEVSIEVSIVVEGHKDKLMGQVFYAKFIGGFVRKPTISKEKFKKEFDLVASEFQSKLYYVVRPYLQEILNTSVLRQIKLPWDTPFDETSSKRTGKRPKKAGIKKP